MTHLPSEVSLAKILSESKAKTKNVWVPLMFHLAAYSEASAINEVPKTVVCGRQCWHDCPPT
jgi:hypothetical protein